ncbi:MAG: transposase [Thiolinea sp.]
MSEITTLLVSLQPFLRTCHFRQLTLISEALLMMHGRITMLSISRWTGRGGSYRTIQRFFNARLDWGELHWELIKPFILKRSGVFLLLGDASTVTKAGQCTFGVGRFFSSIYSRAVPGISFQTLSLLEVDQARSWPLLIEQILPKPRVVKPKRSTADKRKSQHPPKPKGRPKGSKNQNRREVELNTEMKQVQGMLKQALARIGNQLKLCYFVYDGAFGNNAAVQMTRQTGLHLISKLRNNSALYFRWQGVYAGRGARRRYGERVDYTQLPVEYLTSETIEKNTRISTYQFTAIHKTFADPLNVVVILKLNEKTGKTARVILFSTDLELAAENLVKYYRLRFQIEFNFRDAKQHWGLEDFMVIQKQPVSNAANLSLFMVNLTQAMMAKTSETSVLDLKARYHGRRYAQEAFKILPQRTEVIIFEEWIKKIPVLGRIHDQKMAA